MRRSIAVALRGAAAVVAALAVSVGGLAAPASADKPPYKFTRLAKAQPDECFNGVGQPYGSDRPVRRDNRRSTRGTSGASPAPAARSGSAPEPTCTA